MTTTLLRLKRFYSIWECVCVYVYVLLPGRDLHCLQVVWTGSRPATDDCCLLHTSSHSFVHLHINTNGDIFTMLQHTCTHTHARMNTLVQEFEWSVKEGLFHHTNCGHTKPHLTAFDGSGGAQRWCHSGISLLEISPKDWRLSLLLELQPPAWGREWDKASQRQTETDR